MKFVSAFRKLILILLLSASTAEITFAQNIVSGNIQSVPFQTGVDSAEVILENGAWKHGALTSVGKVSFDNVPNGSYNVIVKAPGTFLYQPAGTINVTGNYDSLDIQAITAIPISSKYYNSILPVVKNLAAVNNGVLHKGWDNYKDIDIYEDSVHAPVGYAVDMDTAIAVIERKSHGTIHFNSQTTDVAIGISIKYVSSIPPPYPNEDGWTIYDSYESDGTIKHATCYINISVASSPVIDAREVLRGIGDVNNLNDPSYNMFTGVPGQICSDDEGNANSIIATLDNFTNLNDYVDSVITSIDLPPTKPILDSPVTGDSLKPGPATFTWSGKSGSHGVTYTFNILGTSITKTTTDTTFTIDSTTVLNLKGLAKYSWTVTATDNFYSPVPGDTLSFVAIPLPAVVKSHSSISFGTVHADSTALDSIRVTNSSTIPLVIDSIYTATKWFSTRSIHDTLSNTDTFTIPITFRPDTSRAYTDTLYIASNGKIPLVKIPLSGNGTLTAIQSASSSVPTAFGLEQNYPNPFNPTTVITYDIAKRSHVMLTVYDVLGRQVATLVNGDRAPGRYQATFNASDLPSGVYFYRIQADNYTAVKKLMLVK